MNRNMKFQTTMLIALTLSACPAAWSSSGSGFVPPTSYTPEPDFIVAPTPPPVTTPQIAPAVPAAPTPAPVANVAPPPTVSLPFAQSNGNPLMLPTDQTQVFTDLTLHSDKKANQAPATIEVVAATPSALMLKGLITYQTKHRTQTGAQYPQAAPMVSTTFDTNHHLVTSNANARLMMFQQDEQTAVVDGKCQISATAGSALLDDGTVQFIRGRFLLSATSSDDQPYELKTNFGTLRIDANSKLALQIEHGRLIKLICVDGPATLATGQRQINLAEGEALIASEDELIPVDGTADVVAGGSIRIGAANYYRQRTTSETTAWPHQLPSTTTRHFERCATVFAEAHTDLFEDAQHNLALNQGAIFVDLKPGATINTPLCSITSAEPTLVSIRANEDGTRIHACTGIKSIKVATQFGDLKMSSGHELLLAPFRPSPFTVLGADGIGRRRLVAVSLDSQHTAVSGEFDPISLAKSQACIMQAINSTPEIKNRFVKQAAALRVVTASHGAYFVRRDEDQLAARNKIALSKTVRATSTSPAAHP